MSFECYVPLRLQISGQLSEADLSTLEEVLVAHYARSLQRGIDEIAAKFAEMASGGQPGQVIQSAPAGVWQEDGA
jgi:hypothetical protein